MSSASIANKDSEQQQQQESDAGASPPNDSNANNNNNSNSPKPHTTETAAAPGAPTTVSADGGGAAGITAPGANKASGDISSCLQSSLEQMQQRFQEMVDLILSKLDDMNGQIEELEKILLETVQRSGQPPE